MSIKIEKVVKWEGVYSDSEEDYYFIVVDSSINPWVAWDDICPENIVEVEEEILKEYKLIKEKE